MNPYVTYHSDFQLNFQVADCVRLNDFIIILASQLLKNV